jgi:glyoxylase-like metal-dependent hydrolase (beta-lactamase superfamily II)
MFFHVTIGKLRCTIFADGSRLNEPLHSTFPGVPEDQFKAGLTALGMENKALVSFNCLLIRTDNQYILVDTGNGISENLETGLLLQSMHEAGTLREDITHVILSHGHGDHYNGVTLPDGRITFPNAHYLMWHEEWVRITQEPFINSLDEHRALALRTKIAAMRDRLRLIEQDGGIAPGVSALHAPGHTPGQIAINVESEGSRLLYLADVMNIPVQVYHPDWAPRMDMDGLLASTTRRRMLQYAADTNSLTLLYHFPFPGLGRITTDGENFAWRKA